MMKLTTKAVMAIRAAYRYGESEEAIAPRYGITPAYALRVISGHTWAEVPGAVKLRKKKRGRHYRGTPAEMLARVTCACGEFKSRTARQCRACATLARTAQPRSPEACANIAAGLNRHYAIRHTLKESS